MHFIDVRLGKLPTDEMTLQQLTLFLDRTELSRAESYKTPLQRNRFIAVRGLLRSTLAHYLAADPASLQFAYGPHGKPALVDQALHFNLSHSADTLAIAVSDQAQIGVDIEWMRPRPGLEAIAERCFSAQEFTTWQSLPTEMRQHQFYRLWTKKEAFVKAVGRGLALGLEQCEIDMRTGLRFANVPGEHGAADDWHLRELLQDETRFPGFCGALVSPTAGKFCQYRESGFPQE